MTTDFAPHIFMPIVLLAVNKACTIITEATPVLRLLSKLNANLWFMFLLNALSSDYITIHSPLFILLCCEGRRCRAMIKITLIMGRKPVAGTLADYLSLAQLF